MKTVFYSASILIAGSFVSPASGQVTGSTTATGTSTVFNPAISVNGLLLGFYTSMPLERTHAFVGITHSAEESFHGEGQGMDGGMVCTTTKQSMNRDTRTGSRDFGQRKV